MSCKSARVTDQYHGWECMISGSACMFLSPNSKLCAEGYGEGPDAVESDQEDEENVITDDLTNYECWDCENQFIAGDRAAAKFPDRSLRCPYCGSDNVEGMVFAEADEVDDMGMGCLRIKTKLDTREREEKGHEK